MPRPVPVWKTVGESFADVFMGFLMAFNNRDGQQGGVGWGGVGWRWIMVLPFVPSLISSGVGVELARAG